jgi:hypothetical protein
MTRRVERLPSVVELFRRDDSIAYAGGGVSSTGLLRRGRGTGE